MESVTVSARKYREDFFVQTEVNIIALQVAYAAVILVISITSLLILYHSIGNGIAQALAGTHKPASDFVRATLVDPFAVARQREIIGLACLIFAATALFGYLVARLALRPARNALAAQKQFIGNIAHELRTPLSIIKTNTEIRLMDNDLPHAVREMHEDNLEELDRISNIINNLLSLNALIRPEQMPFEPVDLGKIVERVVQTLSPLARGKHLRIRVSTATERTVRGNPAALEQIIVNLVRNAIAHTKDGQIHISVAPALGDIIEVIVEDTGSGIRQEDLSRIFEPFYRGDRARSRSGGSGSGLGLTIVSELVKLHRGRVSIKSSLGKGTSVSIKLPAMVHSDAISPREMSMNEVFIDFANSTNKKA